MNTYKCDVAVIGAGPAGLAAAVSAKQNGAEKVMIIERDGSSGGILQQCIHPGFGLNYFGEELTGPEYAWRFITEANRAGIEVLFNTMAFEIKEKEIICSNKEGVVKIETSAVILAMGCRERTRANLVIPGSRPAGIYTAGSAQRLLNMQGHMVGKTIVILGSGDIGMIMARRLTLEGAKVKAVVEIMPYLAGLTRNKVQCLDDFGIPLMLSHTVIDITGTERIESVTIAPVGPDRRPDLGKTETIECDTLLLSVGLIPENEFSKTGGVAMSDITKGPEVNQFMQTDRKNIFACGNVLHVNDLVDNVSRESENAGRFAALYARGELCSTQEVRVTAGKGVRYVCPQRLATTDICDGKLFFRVAAPGKASTIFAGTRDKLLNSKKVRRTSPGEMEFITVPAEEVGRLTADVKVWVEEE